MTTKKANDYGDISIDDIGLSYLSEEDSYSLEWKEELRNIPIDPNNLREAQAMDPQLTQFFDRAVDVSEKEHLPHCFTF